SCGQIDTDERFWRGLCCCEPVGIRGPATSRDRYRGACRGQSTAAKASCESATKPKSDLHTAVVHLGPRELLDVPLREAQLLARERGAGSLACQLSPRGEVGVPGCRFLPVTP